MKKFFIVFIALLAMFTITACGSKDVSQKESNITTQEKKKENTNISEKQEETLQDDIIIDDEIIDIDEEDNLPPEGTVNVEKVVNCDKCVYAYFSAEGDKAKKLGDTVSPDEYTDDINTLKTSGGKQRHNFFGLVLSGNTISRAYACILKDNKIYCLEGSTNGAYHDNNKAILNQVFTSSQCKTISDGHTYTCTDNYYNGDTKTNGYTSMHYETSCTIYGANSNTGKLICH